MDELKLNKWKEDFTRQASSLQIEFDSFFKENPLTQYYSLKVNDVSEELTLIIDNTLPEEIKKDLQRLLVFTKPEDSI